MLLQAFSISKPVFHVRKNFLVSAGNIVNILPNILLSEAILNVTIIVLKVLCEFSLVKSGNEIKTSAKFKKSVHFCLHFVKTKLFTAQKGTFISGVTSKTVRTGYFDLPVKVLPLGYASFFLDIQNFSV